MGTIPQYMKNNREEYPIHTLEIKAIEMALK
jgi:hypothetical protein